MPARCGWSTARELHVQLASGLVSDFEDAVRMKTSGGSHQKFYYHLGWNCVILEP